MREWQVSLEMLGTDVYDERNAEELLDRLKRWHAALSLRDHEFGVTMTVRAVCAAGALDKGLRIVKQAVPTLLTERLSRAAICPMEIG